MFQLVGPSYFSLKGDPVPDNTRIPVLLNESIDGEKIFAEDLREGDCLYVYAQVNLYILF